MTQALLIDAFSLSRADGTVRKYSFSLPSDFIPCGTRPRHCQVMLSAEEGVCLALPEEDEVEKAKEKERLGSGSMTSMGQFRSRSHEK